MAPLSLCLGWAGSTIGTRGASQPERVTGNAISNMVLNPLQLSSATIG